MSGSGKKFFRLCFDRNGENELTLKDVQKTDKTQRYENGLSESEDVSGQDETNAIVFPLKDQIGGLAKALKIFQENNINILHIESRQSNRLDSEFEIYVEVKCEAEQMEPFIKELKTKLAMINVNEIDAEKPLSLPLQSIDESFEDTGMPWFPKKLQDFDICANRVLMYGAELDADHPGFKDTVYRERRKYFVNIATNYKHGQPIPRAQYTEEEINTWRTVFRELTKLYPSHACKEFLSNLQLLIKYCGYREDNIPQLEDISSFLKQRSGFILRPVAGYLSARDFLSGLAFRLFHCTQYIRHSSDPFYTPEPDCCHEILGHMPMLAEPSFAQFSQEIGLASLGASDEEVSKLATVYFFTIEFGLCKQNGELRVFGAGLLSSIAELKHVLSDKAVILPFEPEKTCSQECLITTFQDVYFQSDSFEIAKEKMRQFADTISRPFGLYYNPYTQTVEVLNSSDKIATFISQLKCDLCIVTNALRKIQKYNKEPDQLNEN